MAGIDETQDGLEEFRLHFEVDFRCSLVLLEVGAEELGGSRQEDLVNVERSGAAGPIVDVHDDVGEGSLQKIT